MHYLFGFSGRINRAKMWLFILVGFACEIVALAIAIAGLHWSNYINALNAFVENPQPFTPAPIPWPDPPAGNDWIAIGLIAAVALFYIVAYLAVAVKRLHDRNKGAIWLLPYVVLPGLLQAIYWLGGPTLNGIPVGLFAGPMGIIRGLAYIGMALIGLWVFIELFFFKGTTGDNRYGSDPLIK